MAGATARAPASHLQVLTSGFLCQRPGSSDGGWPPLSPCIQPGHALAPDEARGLSPLSPGCWLEGEEQGAGSAHRYQPRPGHTPSSHPPLWQEEREGTAGPQCSPSSALGPVPGTLGLAQHSREALALAGAGSQVIWLLGGGALVQTQAPGMTITPASDWLQGTFAGELGPRLGW